MIIKHKSNSIRLTGRWNENDENMAVTTAPGAMIECAFTGKSAVILFDMKWTRVPFPHIWISLDNGTKIEAAIDSFLRVEAEDDGDHYLRIVFKSAVEAQHRWYEPLEGKLAFCGIEADGEGILPEDNRKIIEFIGDSITEGVLVDERNAFSDNEIYNRVYQDDSTATYAYLTSQNLNLRPVIMGYGAVGITKSGQGSVPKVEESYPYNYNGVEAKVWDSYITVINHGANDRGNADRYIPEYYDFLKLVRSRNAKTKIVVLSPFCGFAAEELRVMVEKFNKEEKDNITYINTKGWIPEEPLHPLRDGHKIVADNLTKKLKELV